MSEEKQKIHPLSSHTLAYTPIDVLVSYPNSTQDPDFVMRTYLLILSLAFRVPNSIPATEAIIQNQEAAIPGLKKTNMPLEKGGVLLSYADVIEKVHASVVTVRVKNLPISTKVATDGPREDEQSPFDFRPKSEDPGQESEDERPEGGGSGFIITPDGLVLTNAHVVRDAEKVYIRAVGKDKDVPAVVVGMDTATDVALLKVEGSNWQPAILADSSLARPGDIALAIGSPFGLEQTITLGIVSATGRGALGLIEGGMEDFIQTDAAINPGNSGGPLLDGEGRVIGINTARFWADNIGFAVPINLAIKVAGDLRQHGWVVRGHLGVGLREMTPSLAEELGLPRQTKGVVIASVEADQPGAHAGFKPGDVVTRINQRRIENGAFFRLAMAGQQPGDRAVFLILRKGVELRLEATLAVPPEWAIANARRLENEKAEEWAPGLHVAEINAHWRVKLALPPSLSGLVVSQDYKSAEGTVRLRTGDAIQSINGTPVTTREQGRKLLSELKTPTLLIKAQRGAQVILAAVSRNS